MPSIRMIPVSYTHLENEFHKSMKNMEDLFTQNKDKWVDEIFTRCTK